MALRSLIVVGGILVSLVLTVGCSNKSNEHSQSQPKASTASTSASVKPNSDQASSQAKSDMPESIFEGKTVADFNELTKRAEFALSAGNFGECAKYFQAAINSTKTPNFDLYHGLFHCKYLAYKLDYTKKLPEDKRNELLPIAKRLDSLTRDELDALNVAIVWMMMRDRERCAAAVERMGKYMSNHEGLLSDEEKRKLEVETEQLAKFIRNPKTSFEDIAQQFSDIIGF